MVHIFKKILKKKKKERKKGNPEVVKSKPFVLYLGKLRPQKVQQLF